MTPEAALWSSAGVQPYTCLFRFAEIAASQRKSPSRDRGRTRSCLISPGPPETMLDRKEDCFKSSACYHHSFWRHASRLSWKRRPFRNKRRVTDCSTTLRQICDCRSPNQTEGAALPSDLRVQRNSSTLAASIEPKSSSVHPPLTHH